jgi:hypothetical protein
MKRISVHLVAVNLRRLQLRYYPGNSTELMVAAVIQFDIVELDKIDGGSS